MPGHASNMSDTIKSITSLLFLLVETSTAQFLCSNEELNRMNLEALRLCLWVLVRKSLSFSDMFVCVVPYFSSCCFFICLLCVAFCPEAT